MAAKKSRHQTPEEKGKYMKKKRAQSSPRRKSCGVSTPIEDRSPGRDAGYFFVCPKILHVLRFLL